MKLQKNSSNSSQRQEPNIEEFLSTYLEGEWKRSAIAFLLNIIESIVRSYILKATPGKSLTVLSKCLLPLMVARRVANINELLVPETEEQQEDFFGTIITQLEDIISLLAEFGKELEEVEDDQDR